MTLSKILRPHDRSKKRLVLGITPIDHGFDQQALSPRLNWRTLEMDKKDEPTQQSDASDFELTGHTVACAVSINRFEENANLLIVGADDMDRYRRNEEAFLRHVGIIKPKQPFNGIIDETSRPPKAAPPPGIPDTVCIYVHVESGGCKCTFKKKCYDVLVPIPPGMPTGAGGVGQNPIDELTSSCGNNASTLVLEIDHTLDVLLSPRALNTLLLDPSRLTDSMDLMGLPTSGVRTPLFDLSAVDQTAWHLTVWAHIVSGSCKCNYLPVESNPVQVRGKIAG